MNFMIDKNNFLSACKVWHSIRSDNHKKLCCISWLESRDEAES